MRKERKITIKVIEREYVSGKKIAEFFAKRYSEKEIKKS